MRKKKTTITNNDPRTKIWHPKRKETKASTKAKEMVAPKTGSDYQKW